MTKIYFANYLIECQLCVDFQVLAWILQSGPLLRKSSSTYWELACEAVNHSNVDQTAGYLQFHAGCRNKLVPFRTERWTLITLKSLFSVNSKYYNLWKCTEFRVPKHLKMVMVLNSATYIYEGWWLIGYPFMRGADGLDTEFHSTH